jgi:hypothetical protein
MNQTAWQELNDRLYNRESDAARDRAEQERKARIQDAGALAAQSAGGILAHVAATMPSEMELRRTTAELARAFKQQTARLRQAFAEAHGACADLAAAFRFGRDDPHHVDYGFTFGIEYRGRTHSFRWDEKEPVEALIAGMKRTAWAVIVDRLGVKNVMSVAKRNEFERQLESGELPDIDEDTIAGFILGLADQAKDFARDAAREVFEFLRPPRSRYKTNSVFKIGRRVILWWLQSDKWTTQFQVTYNREAEAIALDGVFHLLDGKGIMRAHRGELANAIRASNDADPRGRGETDYFRFKCYKNGNLHVEFKRLDLVKQLNGLAMGEYVLGEDVE